MKFLYVLHQFYPNYISGTEQYVLNMAREARRRGHDVAVFTMEPGFTLGWPGWREWSDEVEGICVRRFSVANLTFPNPVLAEYDNPRVGVCFERVLAELEPDLVHCFHLHYLGANLLDIARARGLPVVMHLMDFWFLCPRIILLRPGGELCEGPRSPGAECMTCAYADLWNLARRNGVPARELMPPYQPGLLRHTNNLGDALLSAERRADRLCEAFSRPDLLLAPSRFLRDTFAANGFDTRAVRLMPYGVDMDRLAGYRRAAARELRIGYIGTINQHKGVHVLIEAFLLAGLQRARLDIHGRLEDYPGYARDRQFQARADERIRFRGSFAERELGRVLSSIDLLVVPSLWYENTPFVVLEALAAGIPVIASRLGGMTEAFEESGAGRSFPPGDAPALAALLAELDAHPDRLEAMRAQIVPPRTLEQNWSELDQLYEEVMAKKSKRAEALDEPAALRRRIADLEEQLAVRERQVRDLYEQLLALGARRAREEGEKPPAREEAR